MVRNFKGHWCDYCVYGATKRCICTCSGCTTMKVDGGGHSHASRPQTPPLPRTQPQTPPGRHADEAKDHVDETEDQPRKLPRTQPQTPPWRQVEAEDQVDESESHVDEKADGHVDEAEEGHVAAKAAEGHVGENTESHDDDKAKGHGDEEAEDHGDKAEGHDDVDEAEGHDDGDEATKKWRTTATVKLAGMKARAEKAGQVLVVVRGRFLQVTRDVADIIGGGDGFIGEGEDSQLFCDDSQLF